MLLFLRCSAIEEPDEQGFFMCTMVFGCSECNHILHREGVVLRTDPVDGSELVYWLKGDRMMGPEDFDEIPLDLFHNGTFRLPCASCPPQLPDPLLLNLPA